MNCKAIVQDFYSDIRYTETYLFEEVKIACIKSLTLYYYEITLYYLICSLSGLQNINLW